MLQVDFKKSDSILNRLSPREREVTIWFMLGLTQEEIAFWLGVAPRTVHYHMFNVLRKTGLNAGALFRKLAREPEIFKVIVEHEASFEPMRTENSNEGIFVNLTKRERQLLPLIHLRDSEISEALSVSIKTAHFFMRNLFDKFNVKNRRELFVRVLALIHRGDRTLASLFPELAEISAKLKESGV